MSDLTREYADAYVAKGWHVLPVEGKIPLTKNGLKDATNNADAVAFWFAIEYPEANIAIRTGAISGLVVLDIDKKNGGLESYESIRARLPQTPTVRTGGGGLHLYFKHPGGEVKNSAGKIAPGIDLRGDNGYVVAPPSLHDSGANYEWEILPSEVPLADLPAFLLEEKKEHQPLELFKEGKRNQSVTQLVGHLTRLGVPTEAQRAAVLAIDNGLPEAEKLRIVENGQAWAAPLPTQSDRGQAELFSQLFGKILAYDLQHKTWMNFNGNWWEPISNVQHYIVEAARFRKSKATTPEELKFATSLESYNSIQHVTGLAREMLELKKTQLNKDPYLLGVQNGVVNLATGQLIAGTPDQWITRATSVAFNPAATAPRWEQFVREIFSDKDGNERPELVDWIWRSVGYWLTGDTSRQVWFLHLGGGSNGKGTFLGTIKKVFGDYAMKAAVRTFLVDTRRSSIANDLAEMEGARFILASEAGTSAELDSERLKGLVGSDGDSERVRHLYGREFEFNPTGKVNMANNRRPRANDDSTGFWRRVRLIPYERTFPVNDEVPKAIAREHEGILAWAVRGAGEYLQRGLEPPDLVMEKTTEYQEDSDPLSGFVRECLEVCDEGELSAGKAFDTYIEWALKNGVSDRERVGRRKFGEYMLSRFVRSHTATGNTYKGVCLK